MYRKKLLVYTVLVGNDYDYLQAPINLRNDIDYICYTKKESKIKDLSGIWKIEYIDSEIKDNVTLSRLPKIIPHRTSIADYDYSLYIDANIVIKDDFIYNRIDCLINNDVTLALIKHPARDCAYQEAYNCIAGCKARWRDLLRQILFLKINHYPKHNGLYEANVIFRKHNEESIVRLDELWWKTFCRFSKRDQLSLVYALWKLKQPVEYLLTPGTSTINHPSFERKDHLPQKVTKKNQIKKWLVSIFINKAKKSLKE